MPLYDLKCPTCGVVKRDVFVRSPGATVQCEDCCVVMERILCRFSISVFPSDGIFLEHVSPEGHRFMNKNEMKEFEKRTGTTIGYLH